jgi:hypothetical protein
LTIKFTQYTGQSAFGIQPNLFSLLLIAYCLLPEALFNSMFLLHLCSSRRFTSPHQQRSKALIKFTSALCFPKSIQLSKISILLSQVVAYATLEQLIHWSFSLQRDSHRD